MWGVLMIDVFYGVWLKCCMGSSDMLGSSKLDNKSILRIWIFVQIKQLLK